MPATVVGPTQVTLSTTTISPNGWCPTTEQERLEKFAAHTTGTLPGNYSTFVIGNDKPNPIDQTKAWLRLDSAGRPERWYTFANGAWLSPHPVPVGFIQLYMGDITNIGDFDRSDGSTGSTVTATTGPFWEELKDLRATNPQPYYGRCAVHPDTGGNLVTNQTVDLVPAGKTGTGSRIEFGSTGGVETHTLTSDEMPEHTHGLNRFFGLGATGGTAITVWGVVNNQVNASLGTGGSEAHQNMMPFFGCYYIRRTARTHYRVDP